MANEPTDPFNFIIDPAAFQFSSVTNVVPLALTSVPAENMPDINLAINQFAQGLSNGSRPVSMAAAADTSTGNASSADNNGQNTVAPQFMQEQVVAPRDGIAHVMTPAVAENKMTPIDETAGWTANPNTPGTSTGTTPGMTPIDNSQQQMAAVDYSRQMTPVDYNHSMTPANIFSGQMTPLNMEGQMANFMNQGAYNPLNDDILAQARNAVQPQATSGIVLADNHNTVQVPTSIPGGGAGKVELG